LLTTALFDHVHIHATLLLLLLLLLYQKRMSFLLIIFTRFRLWFGPPFLGFLHFELMILRMPMHIQCFLLLLLPLLMLLRLQSPLLPRFAQRGMQTMVIQQLPLRDTHQNQPN
jgi:hypothetical protein